MEERLLQSEYPFRSSGHRQPEGQCLKQKKSPVMGILQARRTGHAKHEETMLKIIHVPGEGRELLTAGGKC